MIETTNRNNNTYFREIFIKKIFIIIILIYIVKKIKYHVFKNLFLVVSYIFKNICIIYTNDDFRLMSLKCHLGNHPELFQYTYYLSKFVTFLFAHMQLNQFNF